MHERVNSPPMLGFGLPSDLIQTARPFGCLPGSPLAFPLGLPTLVASFLVRRFLLQMGRDTPPGHPEAVRSTLRSSLVNHFSSSV